MTTTTPPRDPTQVPDALKDNIGKHDESDFNEVGEGEEEETEVDDSDMEEAGEDD